MEIYFAGTGTSHGIPVIGCDCAVCRSKDPKDTRSRSSVFITGSDGTSIVIDAGPDFRFQALKRNLCRLDALLLTHSHADHVHGIDDLRVFAHTTAQERTERLALGHKESRRKTPCRICKPRHHTRYKRALCIYFSRQYTEQCNRAGTRHIRQRIAKPARRRQTPALHDGSRKFLRNFSA